MTQAEEICLGAEILSPYTRMMTSVEKTKSKQKKYQPHKEEWLENWVCLFKNKKNKKKWGVKMQAREKPNKNA